jgi:hypothetical protein
MSRRMDSRLKDLEAARPPEKVYTIGVSDDAQAAAAEAAWKGPGKVIIYITGVPTWDEQPWVGQFRRIEEQMRADGIVPGSER